MLIRYWRERRRKRRLVREAEQAFHSWYAQNPELFAELQQTQREHTLRRWREMGYRLPEDPD